MTPTDLQTTWFALLGLVWTLYLVLGGTDLGVGMALRRADGKRALRAIGPTWGANDVWLIVAVAATLGAVPGWYAAWTSGLYLPLVVLLAALMLRHLGIELLGHATGASARRWTRVVVGTCVVLAFGWGVVWAAALDGSLARRDADGLGILNPTTVLAGLAFIAVCRAKGIAFLRLRVPEERATLGLTGPALVASGLLAAAGIALWASAADGVAVGAVGVVALGLLVAALVAMPLLAARGRDGRTLAAGALATGAGFVALLSSLFPSPIAGTGSGAVALAGAASGTTTLTAMLVIAAVVLPLLLVALGFAYLRFLRHPDDAPRAGIRALVARAARGTLGELR